MRSNISCCQESARNEFDDTLSVVVQYESGKPFSVNETFLSELNVVRRRSFPSLSSETVKNFVFVHGSDVSHFVESTGLVQSIQRYFPQHKLIYYDLGLYPQQVDQVFILSLIKLIPSKNNTNCRTQFTHDIYTFRCKMVYMPTN